MTHPLTDEICENLMQRISKYPYTDDVIEDMRTAADWQLEQVIKCLEDDFESVFWRDDFMTKFKSKMRPQENQ